MKILLFGSTGQMGSIFKEYVPKQYELIIAPRLNFDKDFQKFIKELIEMTDPDIILNFVAYTDVDGCETNQNLALNLNAKVPSVISKYAYKIDAIFFHISTDYVYNTNTSEYLKEDTEVNPCNFYGKSKFLGEKLIQENCIKYIIIRTSWLYSDIRKNFFLTISELIKTKNSFKVVNDQVGAPTLVYDVVDSLNIIIETLTNNMKNQYDNSNYWGIYNLSNGGETTWHQFAKKIALKFDYDQKVKIISVNSNNYNSIANRPNNSRLDNNKIYKIFGIKLPYWEDSFNNFFKDKFN